MFDKRLARCRLFCAVPADADGGGCDIVAAFDDGGTYTIADSDVHNAPYFGVLADKGTTVDVDGSHVHDIGDLGSGVQRGVGLEYIGGAQGTVSDSTIDRYQKNGFVIADDGTNVNVLTTRSTAAARPRSSPATASSTRTSRRAWSATT